MKRNKPYNPIPIALLAGLLCLFGNTEASALTYEHTLNIPLSEITISADTINGELRSRISVTDGSEYVNKDTLLLPMKNLRFKVPLLSENFRIKRWNVNSSAPMSMDYPPAKYLPEPPHRHYENESTVEEDPYVEFDPSSISSDPVVLMGDYYLGAEEHYLNVGIHAAEYSGSQLKANTSVSFIIEYSMKDEAAIADSPLARTVNMAKASKNVKSLETFALSVDPFDLTAINIQNYVILVPKALESGVTRLKNWKRQKGYKVTVKTFEDIYNDPFYAIGASNKLFDRASQVRQWLRNFYSLNGECYCLIVGDYTTSAPIRKFRYTTSSTAITDPNGESYQPSDLYFADLISEWSIDSDSSGIYSGSVKDREYSVTIPVGRLLCRSTKELNDYTDKLLIYENYPGYGDSEYLDRAFLGQHQDAMRSSETEILNISNFEITHIKDQMASCIEDARPLPSEVLQEINTSGFMSLQYHGTPVTFSVCKAPKEIESKESLSRILVSEPKYNTLHNYFYSLDTGNSVTELTNYAYPNVIYSLACDIAPFDKVNINNLTIEPDKYVNIASKLTTGGKYGAVALLGNTRSGYFPNSSYLETQFMKIIQSGISIGLAENYSKIDFLNHPRYNKNDSRNIVIYCHNIIGDPDISIWQGSPSVDSPVVRGLHNGLQMSSLSGDEMRYSLICGDYTERVRVASLNEIILTLPSKFRESLDSKLGYLMIMDRQRLPYHLLLTSGNSILNCNENLTVRELNLKKPSILPPAQPYNYTTPYLKIGSASNIDIKSMESITSKGGILIEKGGKLCISARKSIYLSDDEVKDGGVLEISGDEVILDSGVTIEKGGSLTINCN